MRSQLSLAIGAGRLMGGLTAWSRDRCPASSTVFRFLKLFIVQRAPTRGRHSEKQR
jgi:hypothetical protein